MDNYKNKLHDFENYLKEEERSKNTIDKYLRDTKKFIIFLDDRVISKLELIQFKEYLVSEYLPSSVNSIIAAVNRFVEWLGYPEYKLRPLKLQKEIFAEPDKELSQREYQRLISTAEKKGNTKLSLLIQTICSTGIRISELQYIDVQGIYNGRVLVTCKGKKRIIFISKHMCKLLRQYCKINRIVTGPVFSTKHGLPMDRSNIWKMMKKLCEEANVSEKKVFPHNLRHLFARTYYKIEKDISRLADILGHANINTTRIYTMETGVKHAKQIEKMNLITSKSYNYF